VPTRVLAVVGPTASGKSAAALDLAERLGAEVVNADSMQLYRGMDIGTAKVPEAERRGIPHHLLDVLEPSEEAAVADYQRLARRAIEESQSRHVIPILVGGSGLYVSSVIQDFDFPPRDPEVRARLEARLDSDGPAVLHARLAAADPAAAAQIDPANGRRIVRALEVVELEGSFTPGLPEDRAPWQRATVLALGLDRAALVARLDARVEGMWEDGLLDEAQALRDGGGLGVTASRAIGYAQAFAELDGRLTREEAVAETQALTRRYARRQVGWFRRYREAAWLDADAADRVGFALARVTGED
jgi:tRNA dimethylallyltransferase